VEDEGPFIAGAGGERDGNGVINVAAYFAGALVVVARIARIVLIRSSRYRRLLSAHGVHVDLRKGKSGECMVDDAVAARARLYLGGANEHSLAKVVSACPCPEVEGTGCISIDVPAPLAALAAGGVLDDLNAADARRSGARRAVAGLSSAVSARVAATEVGAARHGVSSTKVVRAVGWDASGRAVGPFHQITGLRYELEERP